MQRSLQWSWVAKTDIVSVFATGHKTGAKTDAMVGAKTDTMVIRLVQRLIEWS